MTPEEHNKYISWTFLANGLFQSSIVLLAYGLLFAFFVFFPPPGDDLPAAFFTAVFGLALLINLAFLSPNFVAYYALKNRKPWARVASIVAAFMSAMNFPIGTGACIYSLWFFFGEEWKKVYPENPAAAQRYLPQTAESKWQGRYVREDGEVVYRESQPPDWR